MAEADPLPLPLPPTTATNSLTTPFIWLAWEFHLLGCRGGFLGICGIFLYHLVHLGQGFVDLIRSLGLFIRGCRNLAHQFACLLGP